MLYEAKTLKGYKLCSRDGEIGKVKDLYFDDHQWNIRYLVVDTGNWLIGKQVLISPNALTAVDKTERCITVNLTKKQIEDSPSLESDKPVSKRFEKEYFEYYGWPIYYGDSYHWEDSPVFMVPHEDESDLDKEKESHDPQLRSTGDARGFGIVTTSGDFGKIVDYIVDDQAWAIRYLVVDTQDKWFGKRTLVALEWIEKVNWGKRKVYVNLACETFKRTPDYTGEAMLSRDYENVLYKNCQLPGYWDKESGSKH
jgi:sporulation protein YlmC with PRC-barrel domain